MKIEPNMYVRLNCNYEIGIGKTISEIDEDNFIKIKFKDDFECSLPTYMIKKASRNIIDLIELGDVITTNNLCGEVTHIEGDKIYTTCYDGEYCYDYQIQSILTREQFESMKYEVK